VAVLNGIGGGAVFSTSASATAIHPAWRSTATFHVIAAGFGWTSSSSQADRDNFRAFIKGQYLALDSKFSHGLGAYINESDKDDPAWPSIFWGSNYAKLLEVKRIQLVFF
jgi:hypothetical protein